MSRPTIHYGVGITLTSADRTQSIYFQPGDDTTAALEELEAFERFLDPDAALEALWGMFDELAQPIAPQGAQAA